MRQAEALRHVAHSGGTLYMHNGRRGHVYLVCREDSTTIGSPMLNRLLERGDLDHVNDALTRWDSYAVITNQGRTRL